MLSTIDSAKGLEWPVVHLLHLVDGAVPSDMALGREGRRGTPAVLRGRHPGPGPAVPVPPLRMYYHRMLPRMTGTVTGKS